MTLQENVRIGFNALHSQKLRSFLTMLGIIFGVAAVVAMQSIGAGARRELIDAIRLLGVNNVIVSSLELEDDELDEAVTTNPRMLHAGDEQALRSILPGLKNVVPVRREETYIRMPAETKINLIGTTPQYQNLLTLTFSEGRFLKIADIHDKSPVAVITHRLKRELFPLENAVNQQIKIGQSWYTVIGVINPPEGSSSTSGVEVRDMQRDVYIPLDAMQARYPLSTSKSPLQEIVLQVEREEMVRSIAAAAERIMSRRHRNANDFKVIVPIELLKQSQQTQRIFNIVMGAIASISLLVGGIGIMNIMLSSVLERTREIGVRRAVGATRNDVVTQFLIEATLLSIIGGVVGIIFGAVMAWLITLYAGWTTVVGVWAVSLAFGVSAGVGVLFGWWPAQKAAEMDVINALRYE